MPGQLKMRSTTTTPPSRLPELDAEHRQRRAGARSAGRAGRARALSLSPFARAVRMYCVCSDSRRLWRMKWKKTRRGRDHERDQGHQQPLARARPGRRGTPRSRLPGSQPSWTANRITSRMPSQNCGITNPTVESWPVTVEKTRLPAPHGARRRGAPRAAARSSSVIERELERRDDPLDDGRADRAAALLDAEVALDGLLEPDHELHGQRLVEAEALPLGVDEQPGAPRR